METLRTSIKLAMANDNGLGLGSRLRSAHSALSALDRGNLLSAKVEIVAASLSADQCGEPDFYGQALMVCRVMMG